MKRNLSVKSTDEKVLLNVEEATTYCNSINNIWRLPTVEECEAMLNGLYQDEYFFNSETLGISVAEKVYYLTSLKDEETGLPLVYNFLEERAYPSTIGSRHKVRLVQDKFMGVADLTVTELVNRVTGIMQHYIENFDDQKFRNYCIKTMEDKYQNRVQPWRYVLLEDFRMSAFWGYDYPFRLFQDMDMVTVLNCDYKNNVDWIRGVDQRKGSFYGLLDLKCDKYFRINGCGEFYEYQSGSCSLKDGGYELSPNWEGWLKYSENQKLSTKDFIDFMARTNSFLKDLYYRGDMDASITEFEEKLSQSELANFKAFGSYEVFDEVTTMDEYSFKSVEKSICIHLKDLNVYIEEQRTINLENGEVDTDFYEVEPVETKVVFGNRRRIESLRGLNILED